MRITATHEVWAAASAQFPELLGFTLVGAFTGLRMGVPSVTYDSYDETGEPVGDPTHVTWNHPRLNDLESAVLLMLVVADPIPAVQALQAAMASPETFPTGTDPETGEPIYGLEIDEEGLPVFTAQGIHALGMSLYADQLDVFRDELAGLTEDDNPLTVANTYGHPGVWIGPPPVPSSGATTSSRSTP